jgi:hypothetical protein
LFLSPPAGSSYTSTKKTQNKDYNSESGFGTMVGITKYICVLSREEANTNFIFFGLI